jgi:hypothetical protein
MAKAQTEHMSTRGRLTKLLTDIEQFALCVQGIDHLLHRCQDSLGLGLAVLVAVLLKHFDCEGEIGAGMQRLERSEYG